MNWGGRLAKCRRDAPWSGPCTGGCVRSRRRRSSEASETPEQASVVKDGLDAVDEERRHRRRKRRESHGRPSKVASTASSYRCRRPGRPWPRAASMSLLVTKFTQMASLEIRGRRARRPMSATMANDFPAPRNWRRRWRSDVDAAKIKRRRRRTSRAPTRIVAPRELGDGVERPFRIRRTSRPVGAGAVERGSVINGAKYSYLSRQCPGRS